MDTISARQLDSLLSSLFRDEPKIKKKSRRETFEEVVKPVVKWLQENGDPHSYILIEQDMAQLLGGELGIPFEAPD